MKWKKLFHRLTCAEKRRIHHALNFRIRNVPSYCCTRYDWKENEAAPPACCEGSCVHAQSTMDRRWDGLEGNTKKNDLWLVITPHNGYSLWEWEWINALLEDDPSAAQQLGINVSLLGHLQSSKRRLQWKWNCTKWNTEITAIHITW